MVRGGYAESSAGYGGDLQAEAQAWVEQVTGEPFEGDFADGLRDGVRLCKLLNTIKPSSVRRVNPFKEGQKFKQVCFVCCAFFWKTLDQLVVCSRSSQTAKPAW